MNKMLKAIHSIAVKMLQSGLNSCTDTAVRATSAAINVKQGHKFRGKTSSAQSQHDTRRFSVLMQQFLSPCNQNISWLANQVVLLPLTAVRGCEVRARDVITNSSKANWPHMSAADIFRQSGVGLFQPVWTTVQLSRYRARDNTTTTLAH